MRALTSICLGFSVLGRPVRGLNFSPTFRATIYIVIGEPQKVNSFLLKIQIAKTKGTCYNIYTSYFGV